MFSDPPAPIQFSVYLPVSKQIRGRLKRACRLLFLLLILIPRLPAQAARPPQDHSMPAGHHHGMIMADAPIDPAQQSKLLADKKESEFNHHLAGFFVVLGGALMLLQAALGNKSLLKYIWPASFLLSGMFVFVWSGTELWPFGPRH